MEQVNNTLEPKPEPITLGLNNSQTNTTNMVRPKTIAGINSETDEYSVQFKSMITSLLSSPNTSEKTISLINFLNRYVKEMAPGIKISGIPGANKQMELCRYLKDVINNSQPNEFNRNWNIIIAFFWRYRDAAFGYRYINRFAESWHSGDLDLKCYQNLVNLIATSANPETKTIVKKRVNLVSTLAYGIDELGKQNIMTFYNA